MRFKREHNEKSKRAADVALIVVIVILIVAAFAGMLALLAPSVITTEQQQPQANQIAERSVILSIGGDSASGLEIAARQVSTVAAQTTSAVMTGHADSPTLFAFVCVIVILVMIAAFTFSLVRSFVRSITNRKER